MKLNLANRHREDADELLLKLKKEFYDSLLQDFIQFEAFALAQVVQAEKMKEKFEFNVNDKLIGMEIFARQGNFDQFEQALNQTINEFGQTESERAGEMLKKLGGEHNSEPKLSLADMLLKHVQTHRLSFSGSLFEVLSRSYCDAQHWKSLHELLMACTGSNSSPEKRSLAYLRENLIYCFDQQLRSTLKEEIESLEQIFYPKQEQ